MLLNGRMMKECDLYDLKIAIEALCREYATRSDDTTVPASVAQRVCNEVWQEKNSLIKMYDVDLEKDDQLRNLLTPIEFVVYDVDTSNHHQLWCQYSDESNEVRFIKGMENYARDRVEWKADGGGPLVTIGKILDRPICLELHGATINGMRVLFVNCCSQVADHKMMEDWLEKYCNPQEGGRRARCDVGNFHHMIHASQRKKKNEQSKDQSTDR